MKFKEYLEKGYSVKVKPQNIPNSTPIKTIFRTFNPERMNHELTEEIIICAFRQINRKLMNVFLCQSGRDNLD